MDEWLKYRDCFGLNQNKTDGTQGITSQNGVLFTVEYALATNPSLVESFRINEVFRNCEVLSGLLRRYPNSTEYDSMDNNTAALIFSALYGNRGFAKRMREHGRDVTCDGPDQTRDAVENKYWYALVELLCFGLVRNYWNNTRPSEFCFFGWYGRSPGFMGLLDICATGNSTVFRKLSLLIGQLITAYKADSRDLDGWKLSHLNWYILTQRGGIWELAFKWWNKRLLQTFPGGISDVYAVYYQDVNHPIVKATKI